MAELRTCVVCGHEECRSCRGDDGFGWCDVLNNGEMCCDGECTFGTVVSVDLMRSTVEVHNPSDTPVVVSIVVHGSNLIEKSIASASTICVCEVGPCVGAVAFALCETRARKILEELDG